MNLDSTAGMIAPNQKDNPPSTRREDKDNETDDIQEDNNAKDATINTIEYKIKIKT